MSDRRYAFTWDFIGDLQLGRPNLGNMTRIEVYRLFQYTLRDVLEAHYGTEQSDRLLYEAGFLAGRKFCEKFVGDQPNLNEFLVQLQEKLEAFSIGILRMEKSDPENTRFILTVSEDLDCSGLPDMDHAVCTYDEGFIAGLLYAHTGKRFTVKEVDCWCTGDRTCRFEVSLAVDEA